MARSLSFSVDGDAYSDFSPNRYVSGWERRRRVKQWRERVWGCWYRSEPPPLRPPVRVTITVYRGRAVDSDNLTASVKSILDGLTARKRGPMQVACLPDDSRATIAELQVEGVFHKDWNGREWVHIEVEEVQSEEE